MATYITKRAAELGLKKQDARTALVLEVTPGDVRHGKVKNPKACAFAKACKRAVDIKAAYIFRSTAWLEYEDKMVRYLLPPSMQKEVIAFDRGQAMEPGEYQLLAPYKSSRMSAIKKRSAKRPGRHQPADGKTKRKIVRHHTTGIRDYGHYAELAV